MEWFVITNTLTDGKVEFLARSYCAPGTCKLVLDQAIWESYMTAEIRLLNIEHKFPMLLQGRKPVIERLVLMSLQEERGGATCSQ